jgi:hypothetical protein
MLRQAQQPISNYQRQSRRDEILIVMNVPTNTDRLFEIALLKKVPNERVRNSLFLAEVEMKLHQIRIKSKKVKSFCVNLRILRET